MMMSRLTTCATLAAALLFAGTASAQFYEPSPYRDRGEFRDDYRRGPPRDDYRRGPPRGYDDDRYDRRSYRPDRRFGGLCVTSRGTCETGPAPRGSGCRCYIEGFGPKRGAIQ
jgi:hypothetical protein